MQWESPILSVFHCMQLHQLIASLPAELDLPTLTPDDQGLCGFTIDDRFQVTLEEDPLEQVLHLYSVMTQMPEVNASPLLGRLLEAQLFGREIGEGMAFGYDRETGEILLCRRLPMADLEADRFGEVLTEFINWADHWHSELREGQDPAVQAGENEAVPGHFLKA